MTQGKCYKQEGRKNECLMYNFSDNATRFCYGGGVWDDLTDYDECPVLCPVDPLLTSDAGGNITWADCARTADDKFIADISEIIYYVGMCSMFN